MGRKQKWHSANQPGKITRCPAALQAGETEGGKQIRSQHSRMCSGRALPSQGMRGTHFIQPFSMNSPYPSPEDPLPVSNSREVIV